VATLYASARSLCEAELQRTRSHIQGTGHAVQHAAGCPLVCAVAFCCGTLWSILPALYQRQQQQEVLFGVVGCLGSGGVLPQGGYAPVGVCSESIVA
jgi:hypothetical protein